MFSSRKVATSIIGKYTRSVSRPLSYRVAIIGSGPAGFYTAHQLIQKCPEEHNLTINIFDKLPAPYGLSRYGVAPDHPEVKNCEEYLDNLMSNHGEISNSKHRVQFFGNVEVGKDIPLELFEKGYNSIVLSYGCTNKDNIMNIEGGKLPGVISARQFVNWYNCHPDFYSNESTFKLPPLEEIKNVTIIGNGNVALDVARVLLADPESHWKTTDLSRSALKLLKKSNVKNVNVVARRGFFESAFTNKELRELLDLSKAQPIRFNSIDPESFAGMEDKKLGRVEKRRMDIIGKYNTTFPDDLIEKTWSLKYLLSPVEFQVHSKNPNILSKTVFRKNRLHFDKLTSKTSIVPTAEIHTIENELVILSIGYKGSEIAGFDKLGILFDEEHNRIINKNGKILAKKVHDEEPHVFKKGWYTSGWIKNGPKGVIASTMTDAFETAHSILDDISNGFCIPLTSEGIRDFKSAIERLTTVSWSGWKKINEIELSQGLLEGAGRVKICERKNMLEAAQAE